MNKRGWRWLWVAVIAAVYIAGGIWLRGNGTVEEWLYRIGLAAATVIPVLFTGIYTYFGLTGPAKWWRNPVGTSLVVAALTLVPIAGPLAWVFWVDGGLLHSSWLAWIEVAGPVVSAFAWLRLCALWVWLHRLGSLSNGKEGE